ncbi:MULTISPECIES: hypothetical protein [Flavobacteriaceae]|uniref:hypothetical protein n=1 Tax=Flavobacteriaceae TaxID=49546 RepID=UPI0023495E13|nr:hypothetical protein [Muricauda sp. SP22]MDC6363022.1 hypothetical protein [Muricauda sp. SP22]
MKNFLLLLFLVSTIAALNSCIDSKTKKTGTIPKVEDFNMVNVKNEFQILIPKDLGKTTGLNADASLQYQNIYQEAYIIVIDEQIGAYIDTFKELDLYNSDKSFIENYRETQLQLLAERIRILKQTEATSTTINKLEASQLSIDAKVDGIEETLSYFLTFVEGKQKVYLVMCWTTSSKKEEHRATFETISNSFKLLE